MMAAYQDFPWRVGRKVGRTVYAVTGRTTGDVDILIGVMDTRMLAAEAVACHNARLGWTDPETKERTLRCALCGGTGWIQIPDPAIAGTTIDTRCRCGTRRP